MGCSRFNQHFLGWWSGFVWWIFNLVNVCKTFTTDFRAGNGSLVFYFAIKIDSIKRKKQCAVCLCRGVMDERAILHSTSYN